MSSIELRDVTVDIPVFNASNRSLKNTLIAAATGGQIVPRGSRRMSVRALEGVSLSLPHGARLGLVGHNGAGKSTLMRVIAGIYEPTGGSVAVEGEIATLFDLGFGMDEDATGWDNIELRGRLIGHSRREIRRLADDIAEMSGLGDFLDMPLRTYSTGMSARLAFAVTTVSNPDILLVDEGIGAGDSAFLAKARERLKRFIGNAGILVLASHADDLLREWCDMGIWMKHGRMMFAGPLETVLQKYHADAAG